MDEKYCPNCNKVHRTKIKVLGTTIAVFCGWCGYWIINILGR
jgi:hypothetical protein